MKEVYDLLEEGVIFVDRRMRIKEANRFAAKVLDRPIRHLHKMPLSEHPLLEKGAFLLEKARALGHPVTDSFLLEGKGYFEVIASERVLLIRDRSDHQQVIEMGKTFVANASHELRTPITIIKGFAETLQDLPAISTEMLGDITEKIVRNCQRMENLVKSLLTLSDIETIHHSRFQECDLTELLESCRHLLMPLYPDATLNIVAPGPGVTLRADPDILELALFNLLENAAKYSNGPAHITATITPKGKEVALTIADRGIGIKSQDVKHIFERFYTADKARSRKLGGAGIGLSIVKTIVQKHEGTITATSELGQGTTFELIFPSLG